MTVYSSTDSQLVVCNQPNLPVLTTGWFDQLFLIFWIFIVKMGKRQKKARLHLYTKYHKAVMLQTMLTIDY
jgi:hypothetical protein